MEMSRDAGSIPAASILDFRRKLLLFFDLRLFIIAQVVKADTHFDTLAIFPLFPSYL